MEVSFAGYQLFEPFRPNYQHLCLSSSIIHRNIESYDNTFNSSDVGTKEYSMCKVLDIYIGYRSASREINDENNRVYIRLTLVDLSSLSQTNIFF